MGWGFGREELLELRRGCREDRTDRRGGRERVGKDIVYPWGVRRCPRLRMGSKWNAVLELFCSIAMMWLVVLAPANSSMFGYVTTATNFT